MSNIVSKIEWEGTVKGYHLIVLAHIVRIAYYEKDNYRHLNSFVEVHFIDGLIIRLTIDQYKQLMEDWGKGTIV
jgi:hypothetical protein